MNDFQQYRQTPSIALRNRLVEQHLDLIKQVARRFRNLEAAQEDLELVGVEGLIKAVERFNPATHDNFRGYAVAYIRGAILDYLNREGRSIQLPKALRDRCRQYRRVERELSQLLGRMPKQTELMEAMGLSSQAYSDLQQAMASVARLDAPLSDSGTFTRLDTLVAQPTSAPKPYLPTPAQTAQLAQIQATLAQLPASVRQVLQWEYTGAALEGQAESILNQLPEEQRQYVDQATELLRRLVADSRAEIVLDTATVAAWDDSTLVLHLVENAIDALGKTKRPLHPRVVAQHAKLECSALWHQPTALRRITQPGNDIKSRVEAAIQQLADQPITLALVAKKAGIPQMVLKRYPSLLRKLCRLEKATKKSRLSS